MNPFHTLYRRLAPLFLGIFGLVTLYIPAVQAGMISAPAYAEQTIQNDAQRQRVETFLQRTDVQDKLASLGVDPAQAQARVAAMTDQEVATLNQHLDSLPAGGDSIIGALLLIFLVLLFTDIMGFTNVFPFVKKTAR